MKIPVTVYEEVDCIPSRSLYSTRWVKYVIEGRKWYRVTII